MWSISVACRACLRRCARCCVCGWHTSTSRPGLTLPIALPLVTAAGYDPVWFGIFIIMTIEMAQISPPVGFNLFVLESLTGEPIGRISAYAFPFFLLTLALTVLIAVFPELVLFPLK